jgi:hypothetical protein
MVRNLPSSLVNQSCVTIPLVALFDALDLSHALMGQTGCFSLKKVSSDEFVHNVFEVEFFLCHMKILGHRNRI